MRYKSFKIPTSYLFDNQGITKLIFRSITNGKKPILVSNDSKPEIMIFCARNNSEYNLSKKLFDEYKVPYTEFIYSSKRKQVIESYNIVNQSLSVADMSEKGFKGKDEIEMFVFEKVKDFGTECEPEFLKGRFNEFLSDLSASYKVIAYTIEKHGKRAVKKILFVSKKWWG